MGTLTMRRRRAALSDAALIRRAREGDLEAYGSLFERHRSSASALAGQLSGSPGEADDLVSEAFERVLGALRRGNGPTDAFRPYLLTAVRRTAYDRTRRESRVGPTADDWVLDSGFEDADPSLEAFERSAMSLAFRALPDRWQTVLWHTEIEETPPEQLAAILGVKPNALAALAYRAREGLRQNYVAAHVDIDLTGTEAPCRGVVEKLPRYVRGKLTGKVAESVEGHLADCDPCGEAYREMLEVGVGLRAAVLPMVVGTSVAAAALRGVGAGAPLALGAAGAVSGSGLAAGASGVAAGSVAVGAGASLASGGAIATGVAAMTVALAAGGAVLVPALRSEPPATTLPAVEFLSPSSTTTPGAEELVVVSTPRAPVTTVVVLGQIGSSSPVATPDGADGGEVEGDIGEALVIVRDPDDPTGVRVENRGGALVITRDVPSSRSTEAGPEPDLAVSSDSEVVPTTTATTTTTTTSTIPTTTSSPGAPTPTAPPEEGGVEVGTAD